MSRLADVTVGCFVAFAGFKVVKKSTIPLYPYWCTTQLVPGYQYFDIRSYEGVSVNLEMLSFWNSSTTPGTIYERLELDTLHDNGSHGVPSINLENLVGDNGASYGEFYAAELS